MKLIGRGANGAVYQLNTFIVVKRARKGHDEEADHANEQKIFEFLKTRPQIPYLIRCIHLRKNDTFLEFVPNGSIASLLNQYQLRSRDGTQVLEVSQALQKSDVRRWMYQLCLAVAGLEKVGLIHGDIRPHNMLLDKYQDLKLCDLDRAGDVGKVIEVLIEPFGRLLSEYDVGEVGTYGKAGARTETFAIGSVYYTLLRGYEPYKTESWGGDHFVILIEKFQKREFPLLTASVHDEIIRKCWNGEYRSVTELLAEFTGSARQQDTPVADKEWLKGRRSECMKFIESGFVVTLERY